MQRILENLILKDEDYFFDGDLVVNGKVELLNANLQVSGNLFFKGIADDGFCIQTAYITNGNITAYAFECHINKLFVTGNILVKTDLNACHISCDGNIEVDGFCSVYNVTCKNYLITGDNYSDDVTAEESLYILGTNDSGDLKAHELFLGDVSRFSPYGEITIEAKYFESAGLMRNFRGIKVG